MLIGGFFMGNDLVELGIVIVGVIVLIVAILAIVPFVLMVAWNIIMPYLFGLPAIDFIQALALYIVSKTLLTGINYNGSKK